MILGKEQGTNSVTIKDEPTVDQHNTGTETLLGEMAFNAVYQNADPEKAKKHLSGLSDKELYLFIRVCKALINFAESEYMSRATKKAVQDAK